MRIVTLALILVCVSSGVAMACPSCGEAVATQSAAGPNLSGGFAASIALMLAMPIAIVAAGVWAACRFEIRRPDVTPGNLANDE